VACRRSTDASRSLAIEDSGIILRISNDEKVARPSTGFCGTIPETGFDQTPSAKSMDPVENASIRTKTVTEQGHKPAIATKVYNDCLARVSERSRLISKCRPIFYGSLLQSCQVACARPAAAAV
jgi:hypothetical protein